MYPRGALAVAALVALIAASSALGGAATRDVSTIQAMVPGLPDVAGGWTALVRNDNGVASTVHGTELVPGTVVTLWWVVFNDPAQCKYGSSPFPPGAEGKARCALGDVLFNPAAQASVQYAGGHVIGGSGDADYGAYLAEGDTSGCASPSLPCAGLIDSRAADVHLVLRTHGPAVPGLVDEQLSSFNGGCNPGEPNVGQCMNLQASTHEGS
jgi:hypothetical protein